MGLALSPGSTARPWAPVDVLEAVPSDLAVGNTSGSYGRMSLVSQWLRPVIFVPRSPLPWSSC